MKYRARSPWPPLAALLAGAAVIVAGLAGSIVATALFAGQGRAEMAIAMLSMQSISVALVAALAGWFGGRRTSVLALDTWPGGGKIALAAVGALAVLAPYNAAVYWLAPGAWSADLAPFKAVIHSPAAWLFLVVIAIGAPLSEELLFRGFLQSALAPSRLGFAGASLITTILWTALHAGYSLVGLGEVFLIGVYFAWTLWWTGSLWAPLICHALYNGLMFLLLKFVPLPV
jgi:uncharacterized protein